MTRSIFAYVDAQNARKEAVDVSKIKTVSKKKTTKKKKGSKSTKAGEGGGDTAEENGVKGAKVKRKGRKVGKSVRVTVEECETRVPEASLPIGRGKEAVEEEEVGEEVEGEVAPTNDLESDDIMESPAGSELKACTVVGAKCDIGVAQYYQLEGTMLRHYRATWLSNMVCRKCGKGAWSGKTSVYCCRDGFDRDGMTCDGVCCQGCKDKLILALAEKGRTGSKRKRKVPEHLK